MANLFGDSQEQSGLKPYLKAGIHTFLIKDVFYQPIGESVRGLTKQDGSLVSHTTPAIMLIADVLETHVGGDSKGTVGTFLPIYLPKMDDDAEKNKKRLDRLFHILVNIAPSDKKESFREWLKKQNFKGSTFEENFADIPNVIAKLVKDKKVRYKLIANQEKKGANFPNYYSGFAEPADIAYSETTLKWDNDKEGNAIKGKTEDTNLPSSSTIDDIFSAAPQIQAPEESAAKTDKLPF